MHPVTGDMVDYNLADGEARHRAAPRSFFIPSRDERASLAVGDIAKLLFEIVGPPAGTPSGERMWVEVTVHEHGQYEGTLLNDPAAITTIRAGEVVRFGPEHVIATAENWPLLEKKAFVSRRSHVQDVRPRYVYREDPDNEEDSGWRALVGDESDEEINTAANVLYQPVGFLLDRWPDLRAVLKTDPANGRWQWDDHAGRYLRVEA